LATLENLVGNFNHRGDFEYSVHIAPDLHFIYFNNPKCACTTLKSSLNLSYANFIGQTLSWPDSNAIHVRSNNLLLSPGQVGIKKFLALLDDPGVFKFCFLRDPVSRLASAFASKIGWASYQYRVFAEAAGRPADWRPTFDEFVMEMKNRPSLRDCDEHWRLQARQLCRGMVDYDFVGDFENIGDTLPKLLARLFGSSGEVFDARSHFRDVTSQSAKFVANASADTLDAIGELYAADFDWYKTVLPWIDDATVTPPK
jgi:hypothetical protein